ncbi:MAG TPA: proline--tRNA ligase, partial [Candidatus Nanoarchaeia archaeon]|nr:proline--tRNA ligase [Candidatus Nanoarchaeia archaeon]
MAEKQQKKEQESREIGITAKKEDDYGEWFSQIIIKAELVDYTDVSGCYVYRPNSYEMWEKVQRFMDREFRKRGVRNAYFPLFIPEKLLNKEKEHVKGFTPEVAWVTHTGESKLAERLDIRPTSEMVMYDSYKKWIRSWRDLPLKINQWCNVVRWEFKNPVPFIRS